MAFKEVKHLEIKEQMKVSELVEQMSYCGFNAKKIGEAAKILGEAIKDKECKVFFGLAGAYVPGGMRQVVIDMLKRHYIDVFVSTGATFTHDLIEALNFKHYQGSHLLDDGLLNKKGLCRIYDVLLKNKVYEKLEKFFCHNFDKLAETQSPKEFLWKLGSLLPENSNSILRTCYDNRIPCFCPALTDCGIGLMIWGQLIRKKKINLDFFRDLDEIIELSWQSKRTAVLYISYSAGGTPKNFIQQALQFTKPASFGVQITTEIAQSGGSAGAPLKEGISWGKLAKNAKFTDIFCDATIALPLIYAHLLDTLKTINKI